MNSNSLANEQKQKQTNKYMKIKFQNSIDCKIEIFVLYNEHQNCLEKSLGTLLLKFKIVFFGKYNSKS